MKMVPNEEFFIDGANKSVVIVGPSQTLKGRSCHTSSLTLSTLLFVSTKVGNPATVFDKEEQDTIAEVLYEDCFHEDYETFELFQKTVSTIPYRFLAEDIGTRTDVLYNNYDRNMVSGGWLHHPAI